VNSCPAGITAFHGQQTTPISTLKLNQFHQDFSDEDELQEIPCGLGELPVMSGNSGKNHNKKRRQPPNVGGDSDDHGYSTMTPHEDSSEHGVPLYADRRSYRHRREERLQQQSRRFSQEIVSVPNPYRIQRFSQRLPTTGSSRASSPLLATENSVVSAADSANGTDCNAATSAFDDDDSPDEMRAGQLSIIPECSGNDPKARNHANRVLVPVQVHVVDN
jgi:hypothetical protein